MSDKLICEICGRKDSAKHPVRTGPDPYDEEINDDDSDRDLCDDCYNDRQGDI